MSEQDLPDGASWTDMIWLRWRDVKVPRNLYALVMAEMDILADSDPEILTEFLQGARDPGHEPPLEARRLLARLRINADEQTRAIVMNSEYGRGVKASRAAEIMTERLGVEITADGVAELWRRGLIPIIGEFGDEPLFDRVAVGRFGDAALAAEATRAGRLLGPDEAAERLQISRKAFDWLVTCGYIRSCERVWDSRIVSGMDGFVYIVQDLDRVAGTPGVDWQALRSAPEGRYREVTVPEADEFSSADSAWHSVPCSPHCRCRLFYGRQPP